MTRPAGARTGVNLRSGGETDEQREIRRTVSDFLDNAGNWAAVRRAMASEIGYDRDLWRRSNDELGVAAVLVPERCGGLGLSFTDAVVVLEEFGRRLVPSPLAGTMVAAAALDACHTPGADLLLSRIAADGLAVAVAAAEPGVGWDPAGSTTLAVAVGSGWELNGRKEFVVEGASADVLLVIARAPDGPGLFVVEGAAAGVERQRRTGLDQTRRLDEVRMSSVLAERVSSPGDLGVAAQRAWSLALVVQAVQCAAAARDCLTMTVDYLLVRTQFGRVLGSFQALKHRCADLAVLVEGSSATAWYAADTVSANTGELPSVAALASAVCADSLTEVAKEAVQLHGGIGFTFEHNAHLFLKRGKADQQLYGSSAMLRRRVGELAGLGG